MNLEKVYVASGRKLQKQPIVSVIRLSLTERCQFLNLKWNFATNIKLDNFKHYFMFSSLPN